MFDKNDLDQIQQSGISVAAVSHQIALFKKGIPFSNLVRPALLGDGIQDLKDEAERLRSSFEQEKETLSLVKFVPASGAATRMFKQLYEFLVEFDFNKEGFNSYRNRIKGDTLSIFFIGLEKFPFYDEVLQTVKEKYPDYNEFSHSKKKYCFVEVFLTEKGLNYGAYPKGLFPFHKYKDHKAAAFEEHLFESALYASTKGIAKLHFTISRAHLSKFEQEFERIQKLVEHKTKTRFEISFSHQHPKTDTIAVDFDNNPLRDDEGKLVFRPGGHGALIENLNAIDADVIFIKNIDNVVVYQLEQHVAYHKKVLAGKLLQLQKQAFSFLTALEQPKVSDDLITQVKQFLNKELNVILNGNFDKFSKTNKVIELIARLNRPLRICGMVRNEGEPGGGPFWVKDNNGMQTLQIIEGAQIDKKNKKQKKILKASTHFNPVDLICGVRDYKGDKFNLLDFVDEDAVFITAKSKNGKELKALELPGLWNGAMAKWNTVFVEVSLRTFSPVKTVNDLLKSEHQIL